MALSKPFTFSDKQSAALSSVASVISTNVEYNANSPQTCFGVAKALEIGGSMFTVQVTTALVGAGGTLRCDLMTHTTASVGSGTVVASVTFPAASVAGTSKRVILPPGTERLAYLGVYYTSGATISSGNVNAFMGTPSQENDA